MYIYVVPPPPGYPGFRLYCPFKITPRTDNFVNPKELILEAYYRQALTKRLVCTDSAAL